MKEWYLNTPTPNICSGYESEEIDEYGVSNFSDVMYTNFSDSVIKCNYDGTNIITIKAIIQGVVEDSVTSTTKRQLLCSIGSFSCGDYVYLEDCYWIVVAKPSNNKVYEKAIVEICTYTIKFQHPTSGTILSYPCITSGTSYSEDESNVITLGANKRSILLPKDANTLLLKAGTRLYIDTRYETTYKLLDPDTTTYNCGDNGLIYIIAEQDLEQNNTEYPDRPDLGICNYREVDEEPKPVEGYSYSVITCSNPNNEITLGSSIYRTLTPTFYEVDGTIASGITAVWNWELPNGYESCFTIIYEGSLAKIKVTENYELLGITIKGNVMGSNGGYGGNIILSIVV